MKTLTGCRLQGIKSFSAAVAVRPGLLEFSHLSKGKFAD